MLWNNMWSIDKEDAEKEVLEIESGVSVLAPECWKYVEEVEMWPGANCWTLAETKGKFTKVVIPDSVIELKDRAFYRAETIENISILRNVKIIGKDVFKGCNGLAYVVAPLIRVSELSDAETKIKLATGFCLNSDLYDENIKEDYFNYLKRQKGKVLQSAEKYSISGIEEFLLRAGILAKTSGDAKKKTKKLGLVDAVLLLEKMVLTGTVSEIRKVIDENQPFQLTARALGLAARCRSKEIVELLIKNGATFQYDEQKLTKYGLRCKQSAHSVYADFTLLAVVDNVWNQYIFGSFDKHYAKKNIKVITSNILNTELDFSDVPEEMKMQAAEDRVENIKLLYENKLLGQKEINKMLYYAILEEEEKISGALRDLGAVIDVPWLVSAKDHSTTISEHNQFLDAMNRKSIPAREKVLMQYNDVMKQSGTKLYVNTNAWWALEADESEKIAKTLLENGDVSSINKSKFLKAKIAYILPGVLKVLLDYNFVTSAKLRDELIETASNHKKTENLAVLMEYKNKTADLISEEKKRTEKEIKDLTAAPDSAYELKKSWITKKKDDGTLIITSYKGEETEIVVPEKIGKSIVTEIGAKAFSPEAKRIQNSQVRKKIRKIILPDTITKIGDSAFAQCKKLETIVMPDTVETFDERVFLNCESLVELELPKKAKGKISWYFFGDCVKLRKLVIPNGISTISNWSFSNCSSLEEIHFKKGTKKFEYSDLEDCKKVTIYAPEGSSAQKFAMEHGLQFVAE